MRAVSTMLALLILVCIASPSFAQEEPRPESIIGKMAVKLTRGVTNIVTSPIEIPKQTVITTRDMGPVGLIVGPLKGIGMTAYRAFIGCVETAFFTVPQPGYYDPTIDPDYVWNGWEEQQTRLQMRTGSSE
jgi:putative exosortase-associated protein (TIGR04073 family)